MGKWRALCRFADATYMTEVIYEPVAWKHACEETYKFVYARLSVMN